MSVPSRRATAISEKVMPDAKRRRVEASVVAHTTGGSVASASSGRERALEPELAEDAVAALAIEAAPRVLLP